MTYTFEIGYFAAWRIEWLGQIMRASALAQSKIRAVDHKCRDLQKNPLSCATFPLIEVGNKKYYASVEPDAFYYYYVDGLHVCLVDFCFEELDNSLDVHLYLASLKRFTLSSIYRDDKGHEGDPQLKRGLYLDGIADGGHNALAVMSVDLWPACVSKVVAVLAMRARDTMSLNPRPIVMLSAKNDQAGMIAGPRPNGADDKIGTGSTTWLFVTTSADALLAAVLPAILPTSSADAVEATNANSVAPASTLVQQVADRRRLPNALIVPAEKNHVAARFDWEQVATRRASTRAGRAVSTVVDQVVLTGKITEGGACADADAPEGSRIGVAYGATSALRELPRRIGVDSAVSGKELRSAQPSPCNDWRLNSSGVSSAVYNGALELEGVYLD